MTTITGLTEQEALARRQRGEGNNVEFATSRSYRDIIRFNVFSFFNIILFVIGAILVLLGRPQDAITGVGVIFVNVVVGVVQEVRAKRKLDEIALLTRPKVTIRREGAEKSVDPSELVRGDVLVVETGDQLVVDGPLLEGRLEMDESPLTGESDRVEKALDDTVYSGSFCVSGKGLVEADKVGADSFANQLTASARKYQVSETPVQKDTNLLVRIMMLVAMFYGLILMLSSLVYDAPLTNTAQIGAVVTGLVPYGLFMIVIIAYSLGAVRLIPLGALVQQSNAIEALSHVDVLCVDKTGTLTANRIHYHQVYSPTLSADVFQERLANFARSASSSNKTSDAVLEALGGQTYPLADEVPFSSARKWSAVAFQPGLPDAKGGVYVMGAFEMLQAHLTSDVDLTPKLREWADQGLRVLVFANNPEVHSLHDASGEPALPTLTPLGLVSFSDELREKVQETISGFYQAGVQLKVISGDSPDTVKALAIRAGLPADARAISGPELMEMGEAELRQVAEETDVFGRITPEQKEMLVEMLRSSGHFTAMIGDGVNDVLSLKKADVGVAMQSGSSATRAVADIVLLNDSFDVLLPGVLEGQKIVNSMADILRLFVSRSFSDAMLIAAVAMMVLGFPSSPTHLFVYTTLAIGIPTFFLALWAKPEKPAKSLVQEVLPFVFASGVVMMLFGLLVYTLFFFVSFNRIIETQVTPKEIAAFMETNTGPLSVGQSEERVIAGLVARSGLTTFATIAGVLLILFIAPPFRLFVAVKPLSSDKRPAYMVIGLLVLFFVVLAVEPVRQWFELAAFGPRAYFIIGIAVLLWLFTARSVFRAQLFERFIGLERQTPPHQLT
jgi:cation-transporting ATPase E